MGTVLITGANRGLGLEHARRYAQKGWRVIAGARDPASAVELQRIAATHPQSRVLSLDVTDHDAVDRAAASLQDTAVDLLLNNAGSYGPQGAPAGMAYQSLTSMDYSIWRDMLEVNLLGAFKVAVAFRDRLAAAERPLLVMMSSGLGSITHNQQGHSYAYRSSKAGLNMLARGMAAEWPDIIVVAMAPGWSRTDLGGPNAPISAGESVAAQQATFDRLSLQDSGRYIDRAGDPVPW
jgi:NAD(P)-dependent dehydrogenase (short-subunit alcohol dehydrogenase family)